MTLISKTWLRDCKPVTDALAEGRGIRTVIFNTTNSIVIYNGHNFNLEAQQLKCIERPVLEDLVGVAEEPSRRTSSLQEIGTSARTTSPAST